MSDLTVVRKLTTRDDLAELVAELFAEYKQFRREVWEYWGLVSNEPFSLKAFTKIMENEFGLSISAAGSLDVTQCLEHWRELVNRSPVQTVTLQQAAVLVHRSKRTLENYVRKMPTPVIVGKGQTPAMWNWNELRPWLEENFSCALPKKNPS
jgi:hypothetical protein